MLKDRNAVQIQQVNHHKPNNIKNTKKKETNYKYLRPLCSSSTNNDLSLYILFLCLSSFCNTPFPFFLSFAPEIQREKKRGCVVLEFDWEQLWAWGSLWASLTKGLGLSQGFTLTVPKQAVSTTTLRPFPTTTPMEVSAVAAE